MDLRYETQTALNILQIAPRFRTEEDIDKLVHLTNSCDFFRKITEEQKNNDVHRASCQVMTLKEYNPEDYIVFFGSRGEEFFIVIKGSVSVQVPTKKKIKIRREYRDMFEDLYSSSARNSKFTANEETLEVAKLKEKRFHHLFENFMKAKLRPPKTMDSERQEENYNYEETKISEIFHEKLAKEKGIIDMISKFGDGGDRVDVEIEQLQEVSVLKEGASFGELALISERPRAATIKAIETVILAVLNKSDFKKILGMITEKRLNQKLKYFHSIPMFSS